MYIKSLNIEGFGIYHDLKLDPLPQGLIIFLGSNEAGKSTCLEFLRSMLCGFPQGRKAQSLRPLRGGRFGGSLKLILENSEEICLSRYKDKNLGLTLSTSAGEVIPPSRLNELLQGVSREVYTKVFGFSLEELERKLTPEDVQDALYSATFGAGLNDPQTVLKSLNDGCAKIFTPRGTTASLNLDLSEYKKLANTIQELEDQYAAYDSLALKRLNLKQNLDKLAKDKQRLTQKEGLLSRRLAAFDQWSEWQALGLKLKEIPEIISFPEHGVQRLEQLQREERQIASAKARQTEKCQKLKDRLANFNLNEPLLSELPSLLRLAENKAAFKEALRSFPEESALNCRLQNELSATLKRLGADWDCARIRQIDLSLFSHNNLESLAIELRAAQSSREAAIAALEQANLQVDQAEVALKVACEEVEKISIPEQVLDDLARDDLRHTLARLEEAERQRPEKLAAKRQAFKNFQRAWDDLQLEETLDQEKEAKLGAILSSQHKIKALAEEVQAKTLAAQKLEQQKEQLEAHIKSLNARKEGLNQSYQAETPDRAMLEEQAKALHEMRLILHTKERDQEDLNQLELELAEEPEPKANKILPLMLLGGLLTVCGATMLGLNLFLKWPSIPISPNFEIPLSLWSGYLVLFAGILGLWGGSPRNGAELNRRLLERKHKEDRLKAMQAKIASHTQELDHYGAIAQVDPINSLTLDACESRIAKEREHCIQSEHYHKSVTTLQEELTSCQNEKQELIEKIADQEQEVQLAKHAWHECLRALGLKNIPSPSSQATFLTRVEMTSFGLDSYKQAHDAHEHLEDEISRLAQGLYNLKPLADSLNNKNEVEIPILVLAAKKLLQSMHEADRLQANKNQAQSKVTALNEEANRLKARASEANLTLAKTEERLKLCQERWQKCLQDLKLERNLNPQTAKAALECMQEALSLEKNCLKSKDILDKLSQIQANFINPLKKILEKTNISPENSTNEQPDWLATLEKVLDLAKKAEKEEEERKQLASRLKEEENELDLRGAELTQAQNELMELLRKAQSQDIEDFYTKSRNYQERQKLLEKRANLTVNLKVMAQDEPLEEFLKDFAKENRETQELKQSEIKQQLAELTNEYNQLLKELAQIENQVEHLNTSQELSQKLQEREGLRSNLAFKAKEWATQALAHALLQKTRENFEQERQPAVLKAASEIFQRITCGKWKGIVISLDKTRTLSMLPSSGHEVVAPENLSRGTQEQAYLALRLAYILSHSAFAEPLPLLMDEVLVNFDRERAERTAQELARMSLGGQAKSHQIFYFTCHQEIVDILANKVPEACLFKVKDGQMERIAL